MPEASNYLPEATGCGSIADMSTATPVTPAHPAEAIEAMRRFNRSYTRRLGLLDESLLQSRLTLAESRVVYELGHRDDLTASELARMLALDAGYLSRLLKALTARRLIRRTPSASDGRQQLLRLTRSGRTAFEGLDRSARDQLQAQTAHLGPDGLRTLLAAMATTERLLEPAAAPPAVPFIVRDPVVGDMGWVVHRQAVLYAQEYGWDATFEALLAEIAAGFVRNFDPRGERCWIAEREHRIVGSVFLVRESETVGKLRMLYVEPEARGLGVGARLVDECIRCARAMGYRTLTLWTNDVLVSARRIYQAAGFKLVKEEPHHSFGKDLVGQNWDLAL